MGDMNLKEVVVFLDDLIVFSKTLEDHEARLTKVLNRLKEYGLKLSPEKCRFFQSSVRYLGHVVSERGLETDPEKIAASIEASYIEVTCGVANTHTNTLSASSATSLRDRKGGRLRCEETSARFQHDLRLPRPAPLPAPRNFRGG